MKNNSKNRKKIYQRLTFANYFISSLLKREREKRNKVTLKEARENQNVFERKIIQ